MGIGREDRPIYRDDFCWHGDPNPSPGFKQRHHVGLCNKEGAPLYEVGKASMGLGICRMFLCNEHVFALQSRGFTVTKIPVTV